MPAAIAVHAAVPATAPVSTYPALQAGGLLCLLQVSSVTHSRCCQSCPSVQWSVSHTHMMMVRQGVVEEEFRWTGCASWQSHCSTCAGEKRTAREEQGGQQRKPGDLLWKQGLWSQNPLHENRQRCKAIAALASFRAPSQAPHTSKRRCVHHHSYNDAASASCVDRHDSTHAQHSNRHLGRSHNLFSRSLQHVWLPWTVSWLTALQQSNNWRWSAPQPQWLPKGTIEQSPSAR